MTSPTSLDDKESYLKQRLRAFASSNLSGSESVSEIKRIIQQLHLRGKRKLERDLGKKRVERIEASAKKHVLDRWIILRRTHKLSAPTKKELAQFPRELRPEREPKAPRSHLISKKISGISKWRLSTGQIVFRDRKGKFVSKPRRHRLR